jgi:hypothetical protein
MPAASSLSPRTPSNDDEALILPFGKLLRWGTREHRSVLDNLLDKQRIVSRAGVKLAR